MSTDNGNIVHATPKSQRPKQVSVLLPQPDAQQVGVMSREDSIAIRARQDARSRVLGLILAGMGILFFAIAIVKIGFGE